MIREHPAKIGLLGYPPHNLPTSDPELGMKLMAHTVIHRNKLKLQAGVPLTGRKGNGKPVYSFSLAWQPEQEPQNEDLIEHIYNQRFLSLSPIWNSQKSNTYRNVNLSIIQI